MKLVQCWWEQLRFLYNYNRPCEKQRSKLSRLTQSVSLIIFCEDGYDEKKLAFQSAELCMYVVITLVLAGNPLTMQFKKDTKVKKMYLSVHYSR